MAHVLNSADVFRVDVALQPVGSSGLENLAVGLRSLTPLLRQVGYDDAMISMLASRYVTCSVCGPRR
jgi:glutamine synthetase adenylyltransferase